MPDIKDEGRLSTAVFSERSVKPTRKINPGDLKTGIYISQIKMVSIYGNSGGN